MKFILSYFCENGYIVHTLFQVGTVVDSHADFYHDRVPRKERKKTLVDELMANADFQRYTLQHLSFFGN